MKKLLLVLLLSAKVYAMEPIMGYKPVDRNVAAEDIASKIATAIETYTSTGKQEDAQFRELVVAYFEKESKELEARVLPHLLARMSQQESTIDKILQTDDKKGLEHFVNLLITDSIEDAFNDQSSRFEELKQMADSKLKRTQYALIVTVITSLVSIGGTIAGLWFGR